jgi:hypothetical protein
LNDRHCSRIDDIKALTVKIALLDEFASQRDRDDEFVKTGVE